MDENSDLEIAQELISLGFEMGKDFSRTRTGGFMLSPEAMAALTQHNCLLTMDWDKKPIFDAGVGHAP